MLLKNCLAFSIPSPQAASTLYESVKSCEYLSTRSVSNSWTCTATSSPFMTSNHWRRSPMHTWISTFGTRLIKGGCFLHGLSQQIRSLLRYLYTNGARVSLAYELPLFLKVHVLSFSWKYPFCFVCTLPEVFF